MNFQILCSPNISAFKWIKTNSSTFYLDSLTKHVVVGGFEYDFMLHIGRTSHQRKLVIGKIIAAYGEIAPLCYVYEDKEINVKVYEMLIYDNSENTFH